MIFIEIQHCPLSEQEENAARKSSPRAAFLFVSFHRFLNQSVNKSGLRFVNFNMLSAGLLLIFKFMHNLVAI